MLQAIRDRVTGWIAYAIIILISIPFALFGVNSYLGGGQALPAATVNGVEISPRELDTAYASYRQRLAQIFGGAIPESFDSEALLKDQALTQLIEATVLRTYAQEKRYRIGDDELNRLIRSMDDFKTEGEFNPSIYKAQLRSLGYSAAGFEQEFRQAQASGQLQTGIVATAFILPQSQNQFASLSNQTRKIRVLTRPTGAASFELSDAEIEDYYQAQAALFMRPEQIKIDYLELNLERVKSSIEISEDVLLNRYQNTKDAFTVPESREASHILLSVDEGASQQESDEVRERILEIRQQIAQGADFASLAREFSQDPGSAADGGNLGEIEPGTMVQPFETALFAMRVGEISDPVKSSFGWHLIRLEAINEGGTKSFEEVRAELEDELRTEIAEGQIFDMVENLSNLTYEQSDSLLPAAEQLGLEVQTSDWFDRSAGTGIAAEAAVRNLAFSNDVLRQGLNSEAIELADNRIVFVRLNQQQPASQKSLEQVRDEIEQILTQRKGREINIEIGRQALQELKSGNNLDAIAADWGLEIIGRDFVSRDSPEFNPELLKRAFTMDKPEGGRVFDGLSLASGAYSLIELSAVLSNNSGTDDAAVKAFTTASANLEYQSVIKALTDAAEVVKTPIQELQ
ncbi:MAG: SurA N-terminal domain-containing protein [Gammaproteobacteria bacterium]